ncbi:MAG: FAD-dependent oxidoreductase [Chromatiales bacterium]
MNLPEDIKSIAGEDTGTVFQPGHQASDRTVIIIGAGPAGLTAAYELAQRQYAPLVFEKGDKVGGLARTESYNGFYFDLGGHRFFSKAREVTAMWRNVLGEDFLRRPRLSRIYYQRRFFYYPLRPLHTLIQLGFVESLLVVLSYVRWQLFPYRREETFEQWVTNRFGKRLFQSFFKTYTEKVWGIPCSELKAEWAAQRIRDLSVRSVLLNMFFKPRKQIKTLIEEFEYPRRGPGMMWNAVQSGVQERGGTVAVNHDVRRINRTGNRIDSVVVACNGAESVVSATHFISSMPISEFVKRLDPPPPAGIVEAAGKLNYRDFLTVCLIANKPDIFPDNWIYVHDPAVKVGRVQNFKNWSPEMVPDPAKTSLGLEYFCNEGDELWNTPDAALVELARREIDRIGLARYEDIEDGCVVRVPHSYPVYDSDYRTHLDVIRKFVDGLENFQTIGRNGLHRYNNQDHAMLTGMFAARNLALGTRHDLWSVNEEQEYHEEIYEVPEQKVVVAVQRALSEGFARLDRLGFGIATGLLAGLTLCVATLWLVLKGGDVVGPNLRLLNQFFPGYEVSLVGSMVGLVYASVVGFIAGWTFAFVRNGTVFLWAAFVRRRIERELVGRLLDYL